MHWNVLRESKGDTIGLIMMIRLPGLQLITRHSCEDLCKSHWYDALVEQRNHMQ